MEHSKDDIARHLASLPLELLRGAPPDIIGKKLIELARELGIEIQEYDDGLFRTIADRRPDDFASELVRFSYALMERGRVTDLSERRREELRRTIRQLRQWLAQPSAKQRRPKNKRRLLKSRL